MSANYFLIPVALLFGCSHTVSPPFGGGAKNTQAQEASYSLPVGAFEGQSYLCSTYTDGGRCEQTIQDCLSITPVAPDKFIVNLHSTQANQHVCSMSLLMSLEGDALVYSPPKSEFAVRVDSAGGKYEITTNGVAGADDMVYCGAHATIDGYRIQNVRRSASIHSCPSPED